MRCWPWPSATPRGALADAEEAWSSPRADESVLSALGGAARSPRALSPPVDAARAVECSSPRRAARLPVPGAWRLIGLEALERAHLDLGHPDEAARIGRAARGAAAALGLPMATAWAHRIAAAVALDAGDAAGAAQHAHAAIAAAEAAGAEVEVALTRVLAARALAAPADPTRRRRSSSCLRRRSAPAARTRSAAPPSSSCASSGTPSTAARGRAWPDGDGVASLTGRELQVAGSSSTGARISRSPTSSS